MHSKPEASRKLVDKLILSDLQTQFSSPIETLGRDISAADGLYTPWTEMDQSL